MKKKKEEDNQEDVCPGVRSRQRKLNTFAIASAIG